MTANIILRNKVAVLGNATSGKSSLIQSFHSNGSPFSKAYTMVVITNKTVNSEISVKVVNIPGIVSLNRYKCYSRALRSRHWRKRHVYGILPEILQGCNIIYLGI